MKCDGRPKPRVRGTLTREPLMRNLLDKLRILYGQAGKPDFASMGHVWGNFGEYLRARCAYDVKKQRRVPRANQRLRDPFCSRRNSHDPGPQRCASERDLTPTLAHLRDPIPPSFCPPDQGGPTSALKRNIRVRSSGGKEEIGARALRLENSERVRHIYASISSSIAERAAVRVVGV